MTRITEKKAQAEFDAAQTTLRDALVRIQTHRVDSKLRTEDVPDVAEEVAYLLKTGRHYLVPRVIELLGRFIDAKANLDYARSQQGQYAAVVDPEIATPDYLE